MKRFTEGGIKYLQDICMRSPQDLHRISNLELDVCETIWMDARKQLDTIGEIRPMKLSSVDLLKYQRDLPTLESHCEAFDILFGGKGPKCETLTEIYGAFGSGKSQYLFSMTAEALHNGDPVLFIDCEDTFTGGDGIKRLLEIATYKGYIKPKDEDAQVDFIENLHIETATNSTEAKYIVNHISEIMIEKKPKLVIMDGAIGLFRKDFHGRAELSVRQDYLKDLMSMLGSIPLFFKCWAIMTNQVQADPGVFFGDPTKPIGGNIVGHEATYRMYVRVLSDQKWSAKMVDSPHHAKQAITFKLGKKGVEDHPEELKKYKVAQAKIEEDEQKELDKLNGVEGPTEEEIEEVDRETDMDEVGVEDTQGLINKDLLDDD
jgi:DNA repair protein RadA